MTSAVNTPFALGPRAAGAALLLVGALLPCTSAHAVTIDDVMIDPAALASRCTPVDGEHAVSMQARVHFATAEESSLFGAPPLSKTYQSFDCDGAKSTIYYYEYPTRSDLDSARGFVERRIWGGKGPSGEHPELVLAVENVLVIISSRAPKPFKKVLRR